MKSLFNDNRLANLLHLLHNSRPMPVGTLSSKLNVSERTVRNDLKQLEKMLEGCAVIDSDQGRYSLRVFQPKRYQKLFTELLEEDDFLNSSRNRMDYVFGKLMRAERPLLTDDLAYEMSVGRTTLVGDLKKLRSEIEPYHLSIVGKTSKGLSLFGSEVYIREYVLDNNYDQIYRQYPLDAEIEDIIAEVFTHNQFEKNAAESFKQFTTLMLDRFLTGHYIGQLSAQYYNLTSRPEFEVVADLVDRIGALLSVEFPIEEKLFAMLPIIGMRTPTDIRDINTIELDENLRPLLQKILDQIQLEMDIRIELGDFADEFLYHIMFMINRMRFNVKLQNSIADELREKYPLAYQVAGIAARVIGQECGFEVSEDERGYLASYFGVFLEESQLQQDDRFRVAVVCGSGRVTARLVEIQLRKILDSSVELDLYAEEKVTAAVLNQYDLVLTTVTLSCECDRPVIRISEIFNEQELRHKIDKARYWDQVDLPTLDNNWFVMTGLLDKSRFFVLSDDLTYDEALAHMVNSLAESGQVDSGFLERLREREAKGTMVFDHSLALPHGVQYAGDKLVLAIGSFANPIRYRDHEIRIIFLLGLPKQVETDDNLLIRIYDEIISVAQDEALMNKIATADSYSSLLRALYRQAGR